jgi:hypothetical protein
MCSVATPALKRAAAAMKSAEKHADRLTLRDVTREIAKKYASRMFTNAEVQPWLDVLKAGICAGDGEKSKRQEKIMSLIFHGG